ncbi:MAG: hypothetical protein EOM23_09855 [Candidatus Moranbacteria bacterium]|nr:hypothetical protein [Candidatus Moranbacteria bacterium]
METLEQIGRIPALIGNGQHGIKCMIILKLMDIIFRMFKSKWLGNGLTPITEPFFNNQKQTNMKRIIHRKIELLQAGQEIHIGEDLLTLSHEKINKRNRFTLAYHDKDGAWTAYFCTNSMHDIKQEILIDHYQATTSLNYYTGKPLKR